MFKDMAVLNYKEFRCPESFVRVGRERAGEEVNGEEAGQDTGQLRRTDEVLVCQVRKFRFN